MHAARAEGESLFRAVFFVPGRLLSGTSFLMGKEYGGLPAGGQSKSARSVAMLKLPSLMLLLSRRMRAIAS